MIEVLKYENLKYFFVAFLLSLPFWWGVIIFEENVSELFFLQEIAKNPQIFTAQLTFTPIQKPKPFEVRESGSPEIEADSAISIWLDIQNQDQVEEILFEKDTEKILPIASLTKLMTSYIVLEYYPDLSQDIEISQEAVFQEEEFGNLNVGEKLSVKDLLYIMLIESSNDAAFALTEIIGEEGFLNLMNFEAKFLGMENTHFVDPSGVSSQNRSTSRDLVILTKELLKKPLVWDILQKSEFDLYKEEGVFHHTLVNTNELLGKIPEILGGKTGYTSEAKGCFLLVLEDSKDQGYIINVILGSPDRFAEMEKLIDRITTNYNL